MTMNEFIWLAEDPWADIYAMVNATFDQNAFRFRNDDGNEAGATWIAAENTNLTNVDLDNTEAIRLRFGIQETVGGTTNNADFTIQFRINSGDWLPVDHSTFGVMFRTSSFVANGTNTTNQLTTPTGTFRSGAFVSGSDSQARIAFSGNDHGENEFSLQLIADDLTDGDLIEFRLLVDGAVMNAYSQTPSLTVMFEEPTEAYEWPAAPLAVQATESATGAKATSNTVEETLNVSVTSTGILQTGEDYSDSVIETVNVADSASGQKAVSGVVEAALTVGTTSSGQQATTSTTEETVNISVATSGVAVKPPVNVFAQEIADNTVQLTWDAVSGAENGYAIERDEVVIAQDVMVTEYTDEDVPNGERTYRVGTIV